MEIIIIGAGLVGSLLSIYLAKRGYRVSVYERRPDMRKHGIAAGRSINLALSDRGREGLKEVGIEEQVLGISILMKGRMIHRPDGKISYQPYGKPGQGNYSVSRGGLNGMLMDIAGKNGAKFFFEHLCHGIDLKGPAAKFSKGGVGSGVEVQANRIFGTDGAFSAARLQLQRSTDRFNYSQHYLDHGYKELSIAATPGGDFALDPSALHIWPRGQFMLIALPNLDNTFTCTLFFPFDGTFSFSSLDSEKKVLNFFEKMFPDAVPLMPALVKDYFRNPAASLVTVNCFPWSFEDKLLLMGDAAHAIVPFFGQGMNAGFEDCVVLNQGMNRYLNNKNPNDSAAWKNIFTEFESVRKPDGDAIARLAVDNYIEMRDKVADPRFLLQKKIEARFSEKHPGKWVPLYSMVTYCPEMRYSQALKEGMKQENIMKKVMKMPGIEKKWNSVEVEKKILKHLYPEKS